MPKLANPTTTRKKPSLSTIMAVVFFALFVAIYYMITAKSPVPYYLYGLLFAIPCIVFALITYLKAKEKINPDFSFRLTVWLIPIFFYGMCFGVVICSVSLATVQVQDVSQYRHVMRASGYPNDEHISFFPPEIPEDATDVVFHYNPAFLQGGEFFLIKFKTNEQDIMAYQKQFSAQAQCYGSKRQLAEQNSEVYIPSFSRVGYQNDLPEDFIIYILYSKPYSSNNWNHGTLRLVAINAKHSEIIFYAGSW
ncbi:hypothetical protein LJC55_02480 [Eubacteriales bacterium OttesenSCG-928-N14]|nr:hypothetical protein [Eubacteriales bacterium OttesenSCG-928-N14]